MCCVLCVVCVIRIGNPTQLQPNPDPTYSQTRVWLCKPSLFLFFFLSLFFPCNAFYPLLGYPGSLFFMGPHFFTQLEGMCKKNRLLLITKADLLVFFLLFTASNQLRPPGSTLVPRVRSITPQHAKVARPCNLLRMRAYFMLKSL